jgi:hypothetical protein
MDATCQEEKLFLKKHNGYGASKTMVATAGA